MKHRNVTMMEQLSDAKIIVEAASPDTRVLPGQLVAAKTRLSAESASKLWHAWFVTSTGTVILADADMLLAASALDEQSLQEFMLSEKVLDENGMPKRGQNDQDSALILGSWQMFLEGETGVCCRTP